MKLTKAVVDHAAVPTTGQIFYRDDLLTGFALRVTAAGVKSFVVEKRIKGQVRRKTLGRYGALTAEEARKEAQKFLGQVAGGADPIAEQRATTARAVTLGEVLEAYLAARKNLKPSTVHSYRRTQREAFADWTDRPIAHISKEAVAQRHARIGARSPAQANNAMRVLRALFNFAGGQYEDAQGKSLFPENPVARLSHTRAWYRVERRRTWIAPAHLPAWLAAVMALKQDGPDSQDAMVADLLLLLLFTGLRRTEGLRLRWEHIDLDHRTLTVLDTKNREPLTLPLSDFLTELLTARRKITAGPYVFPGTGEHGHLIEPRPQMRRISEQSGVSFILHDLRRTFITVAESLDIPYYSLKRLVNHTIAGDVTAGYIITNVERQRAPMERISRALLQQAAFGRSNVLPFAALDAS